MDFCLLGPLSVLYFTSPEATRVSCWTLSHLGMTVGERGVIDVVVSGLHGTVVVLLENRLRGWVHSEGECKGIFCLAFVTQISSSPVSAQY
jgi:hypothetical protein